MALIGTLKVSCHKATVLIERRDLKPLSSAERVGLWMHLRICDACKTYEVQSQAIDRLLEKRTANTDDSAALEERILAHLHS
jgi:anti-sigma factor ChrR (cupin superfamily)